MGIILKDEILSGELTPIQPPKYNIIFIHQYKSFGSTFSYILAKNYRPESLFHINSENISKETKKCLKKNGRLKRVIFGHIRLSPELLENSGWERTLVISFVRNPIDRIISYYNYIRTKPNHALHEKVLHLSFSQFIRSDLNVDIVNGQARRLLMGSEKGLGDSVATINQISKNVSLLLPTDKFDSHLIALKECLGWSDIYYRVRNKSEKIIKRESLSIEDVDYLKLLNETDTALYEFAKTQSAALLSEINKIKMKTAGFRLKNRIWKKLTQ